MSSTAKDEEMSVNGVGDTSQSALVTSTSTVSVAVAAGASQRHS